MDLITSRRNAKVMQARALRNRKGRHDSGLFLVEGIRHVGEALEAASSDPRSKFPLFRTSIEYVLYAPDLLTSEFALDLIAEHERRGLPCYPVTPEVFSSVAEKDNPQGILAVAKQPNIALDKLSADNFPWGVALVAPQDPGNVGSVLRSIDASGASGLLLLENSVDPYHPASVRASMGTIFWYPVVQDSFRDFEEWARRERYHVYGTSAQGSQDYREAWHYAYPRVLLMGSEREGLTDEQAGVCEALIRLPMRGRATSLNLSVATGIMLYHMLSRETLG